MSKKKPERPDLEYAHPLLDFPDGSGDPNCPECRGRGVVPTTLKIGGVEWPGGGTQNCKCVFKRDLLANVKRVWKVLLNVESAEDSPLMGMTNQNLWITASSYDFRRHLRFVAFRMGPKWDARVVADSTLVTAWLARHDDVHDVDVLINRDGFERERPSEHYMTLVDLAVPFDLLIIRLGVKAAKNRETPNVLAEAINEREQQGKPTWIVDSPVKPLAPGHIAYNEEVLEILDGFRRVILTDDRPQPTGAAAQYKAPRQQAARAVSPAVGGSVAAYTRRKGGMGQRMPGAPPAPAIEEEEGGPFSQMPMEDDGERPESWDYDGPPEMDDDDDEFSVDSLLADAHDPGKGGEAAVLPKDGDEEVEELLSEFPTADELGGNASEVPGWLSGPLTKEERIAEQKQKRYARRGHRGRKGGDDA